VPEFQYKSPISYAAALVLSLPITAIIWFVIIYPVYGLTGETIHSYFHVVTGSVFYLIISGWAIYGSDTASEIVYRICRFGAILSLLIPISTGLTSLIWASGAAIRPVNFLSGLSALEIPVYSAGIALLLILIFLFGSYLAARNMDGIPF